jgi:hypothetical protein
MHHLLFATWKPTLEPPAGAGPDAEPPETIRIQLGGTLGLAPGIVNMLQGMIASNVILTAEAAWVIVIMGGVIAVSSIRPQQLEGFVNTRVQSASGLLDPDQQEIPAQFRAWLEEHMPTASRRVWDKVSQSQREKAQQKTMRALERAVQSDLPEGKAVLLGLQRAERLRARHQNATSADDER